MAVYLLHASHDTEGARHYIGFTNKTPEERLAQHLKGTTVHTSWLLNAGFKLTLARTWAGDRGLEASLKKVGSAKWFCPLCGNAIEYHKNKTKRGMESEWLERNKEGPFRGE